MFDSRGYDRSHAARGGFQASRAERQIDWPARSHGAAKMNMIKLPVDVMRVSSSYWNEGADIDIP